MLIVLTLSSLLFIAVRTFKFVLKPFRWKSIANIPLFAGDLLLLVLIVFQLLNPDLGKMPMPQSIEAQLSLAGLVLAVLGSIFASWARIYMGSTWRTAWDVRGQNKLVTGGPWKFCRHPIYAGSWLFGVGFELALGNWLVFGAIALLIVIVKIAKKEEAYLESRFGAQWRQYAKNTPDIIPGIH